jgi:putative addiction module component (TIGR02574 family)
MSTHALLAAALDLPENERLELASDLIASVDGPADADWDSAWLAELERRDRDARQDELPGAEWSQVRDRLLARLASR